MVRSVEVRGNSAGAATHHRQRWRDALFRDARGRPPLLIIQGGLSEAGATEQLAGHLARRYTVTSYDRRGLSRSTVSPGAPPTTMSTHADDAARVVAAVSTHPAAIVGASIGALIGLHLVTRWADHVTTLIAHEPPMSTVVRDSGQERELDHVAELAREDVTAAIRHMAALTGGHPSAEDGAAAPPPVGDLGSNLQQFFRVDFGAVRRSQLTAVDIAAIPSSTRVIPTGGVASRGQWEYRCAHQLACELDRDLVELPGGHGGLISHPYATAAELTRLINAGEVQRPPTAAGGATT